MELNPFLRIVPPEGFGKALRDVLQVNLAYTVACTLKQSDLILA
jgi:hypothetical protein